MLREFKSAFRSLAARPAYTTVIVATLAVVIGCNTAILSLLNAVLIEPLPYSRPDALVVVFESNQPQGIEQVGVSAPTFMDWRERSQSFDAIAAYRYLGHTLTRPDADPVRLVSLEVSPALFPVLGVSPLLGRAFLEEEETPGSEPVVILSHASWVNRFGSRPDIVDTAIQLDGQLHTVVGVMPAGFEFPPADQEAEAWIPAEMLLDFQRPRNHRFYSVIGRLVDGTTIDRARQEMSGITDTIAADHPDTHRGWGVTIVGARDQMTSSVDTMLWMLFGAGTLVLLIGGVNVANLILARSADSTREFAIRSSFGAGRAALLRLSIAEGLLLAMAGGAAGVGVAVVGASQLRRLVPATVPRAAEIEIDTTVLLVTALVSILAGTVFGLVPAIRTMRPNLIEVLGSTRGSSAGRGVRTLSNVLVASEVALAVILLVGAGLMLSSLINLLDTDPGFRKTNVVSSVVSLPESRYATRVEQQQFFSEVVERLSSSPGIESAGAVSALPMSALGADFNLPFTTRGLEVSSPSERPQAGTRVTVPGYLEAMGIPLLEGRMLDRFDGTDQGRRVALVNETMARLYFRETDPLGQVLTVPMIGDLEVVGIVGDVRHEGLQAQAGPELFVPFNLFPRPEMHLVAYTPGEPDPAISTMASVVAGIDPQQPITHAASIENVLSTSLAQPRFNTALLIGLAFCAVVLAAVGIYAVVSYAVARRTMEIGVRMALGAGRGETLRLIVGESLRVVVVGSLAGVAGAVMLVRLVESMLFGVATTDVATYLGTILAVLVVGLVASIMPAFGATRVDPVVALRHD